jgi:hypothetical protein
MDTDAWKAFGGTLEGKVYVGPGGAFFGRLYGPRTST